VLNTFNGNREERGHDFEKSALGSSRRNNFVTYQRKIVDDIPPEVELS
jgi:hypothetical protein